MAHDSSITPMRGLLGGAIVALMLSFALAPLTAGERSFPGTTWDMPGKGLPEGWSAERLRIAETRVQTTRPTGVIVVHDGRVIAAWGEVARTVNIRSVRKSVLSALFGIEVAEGRIDPNRTLAELGIGDNAPSLTPAEQEATIRHLLMSRSGIYHGAIDDRYGFAPRPERGSHPAGEFWYYNEWDFNALGTIYSRLTGSGIFEAFGRRIARPLGMEDYQANRDGRLVHDSVSEHPAYVMLLSARDLARLGLLYLNDGSWAGTQVVPSSWVKESTQRWSDTPLGLGYGYMWWEIPSGRGLAGGGFAALGLRGQALAVIPSKRLVVAQTADRSDGPVELTASHFFELLRLIVAASPNE
jgi:CubicO group peptidase (beta-lactamase class C family)